MTLHKCLKDSLLGLHHLFEASLVKESFQEEDAMPDGEVLHGVSQLMEALRGAETIESQRALIKEAPKGVQHLFVRLYFDYLSGFQKESKKMLH